MKSVCIDAVQQAIGRSITQAEARDIEKRIANSMKAIARQDPQRWKSLGTNQRLDEAAQHAAKQLVQEASLKRARIGLTIQKHDFVENYLKSQKGIDKSGMDSMERLLDSKRDGRDNVQSVSSKIKGIVATNISELFDAFDVVQPKWLGFVANKAAENELQRAMFGQSKDPVMIKAADAWKKVTDSMREFYNANGGDVGKLDNWGHPQAWASKEILKNYGSFVDDFIGWVDRSHYVKDDGSLYSDTEMRTFLEAARDNIATNGATKPKALNVGGSVKANRHSQERQIFFKDGESAIEAFNKYGSGNLFSTMVHHIQTMARDIALIDTFGPNADLAVAHWIETIKAEEAKKDPSKANKLETQARQVSDLYNYLAGNREPPANKFIANVAQDIRSYVSGIKLGFLPIASLPDLATLGLTAYTNRVGPMRMFQNTLRVLNPANRGEKVMARRAGLMVHTVLEEINRFGTDNMGPRLSGKIASSLIRVTGANMMAEAERRAFSVSMLDAIGEATRKYANISDLTERDVRLLGKGITQETWDIWKAAIPEKWRGNDTVLTAQSVLDAPGFTDIQKRRAVIALMGVVGEERDMAVIEPSARQRAQIANSTKKGTLSGELFASFWMFKSFPMAIYETHWRRGLTMFKTTRGKIGYIATLIAMQTALGAVANELVDLFNGRNPRAMFNDKHAKANWIAAFLKGGALGPYGDFLFSQTTGYGRSLIGQLAGPGAGFVEDLDNVTRGNLMQAAMGEKTDAKAETIRFAKNSLLPNTWWAKAALDHMVFNQLQELANPGYLARTTNRYQQNTGASYWWSPKDELPKKAPDLSKAVGQ